jgi:N-acetylglucosamine-6-phosphate deacetylase
MTQGNDQKILLRGGRIVLSERVIDGGSVLIESGRISSVHEPHDSPAAAETVLDLSGLTLFPGFIDVHIHGAAGVDTMAASAAELGRVSEFLAGCGVTAWLPTLVPGSVEQYQHSVEAIDQLVAQTSVCDEDQGEHRLKSGPLRSVPLGVHYEGPFVNREQCGALHREHFRSFKTNADIDDLPIVKSSGAVHLMTLAPEVDGGIELVAELNRRGWVTSIGHTRATQNVLDSAHAAGARHLTHFMNAMAPLHHRNPGPVGWGLLRDDVTCDLIADGVHLDPSVLKLILRAKSAARVSLISDAIAAAGLGDGDYEIWGETISVEDGRTRNTHGSIAGSVITMLDAVRMMLSLGMSEPEVAQMASLNPAKLLKLSDQRGSIEAGKRADLVALDQSGKARLTVLGGVPQFRS